MQMQGDNINYEEEFSKFFATFVSEAPASYTRANGDLLKSFFVKLQDVIDKDTFGTVWTLVAQELPIAIKNGLHDDFKSADDICYSIEILLRDKYPFLLYGTPLDESLSDSIKQWHNLSAKQKATLIALGAAGVTGPVLSDMHKHPIEPIEPQEYEPAKGDFNERGQYIPYAYAQYDITPCNIDTDGRVHMSKEGANELQKSESFVAKPYFPTEREKQKAVEKYGERNDHVGMTIGYGHVIKENDSEWLRTVNQITKEEAIAIYKSDMKWFEARLNETIRNMEYGLDDPALYTQGFIDAMLSYMYNTGYNGFINSDVYDSWRKCDICPNGVISYYGLQNVIDTLKQSKVFDPGHVRRRAKEAGMIEKSYAKYLQDTKNNF